MKRIALLGPGTYTEESAYYFLGKDSFEYVQYSLITDVFQSTVDGKTDLSVIPVENTFEGSVSLHLDMLVHEVDLPIRAEWVYPISIHLHCLPGCKGRGEDITEVYQKIRKVYTHAVTFAQCQKFLKKHLPHAELEQVSSNGEASRLVKELGDPQIAALGPLFAGNMYGLETLVKDVQDHQDNFTRFVLIGAEVSNLKETAEQKTTILIFPPENYPGTLHQVLSAFAWRRINLSKIESRPTKKRLGSYYFYIDIDASLDSVLLPAALQEIEAIGCQVRILGSYPVYSYQAESSEV